MTIGALTFLTPWILAGLIALPVLWWLLRAIPPSPRTQVFAGVRLLLGLQDEERQTHKTPWWLLLLRCLAIAAALIGLAQPIANLPERKVGGDGVLLILMDQSWASSPDWAERVTAARALLEEAADAGRDVMLWPATQAIVPPIVSARVALPELSAAEPRPWEPDHSAIADALGTVERGITQTVWLHDGLAREGTQDLMDVLTGLGPLHMIGPEAPALAVTPPRLEDGVLKADVLSAIPGISAQVVAFAQAEDGGERRIAVAQAESEADTRATVTFDLPTELLGTVSRIALSDRASAGGAAFADGAIRRISAGLAASETETGVTTLTSATHYLEKAVVPWADLSRGDIATLISSNTAVIILSDHGDMPDAEREALTRWVEDGGLLIRFAGPRLAASVGSQGFGATRADDPLLPVRLRRGGRVLGGALAWSTPRALGAFGADSPFRGLSSPDEVDVRTQVLAEPSPDLAGKVWASLDDGTPLVTASTLGSGQVVLFHISSDAEWSSLPLSGLFVEMLGRLMALAPGRSAGLPDLATLEGTLWRAEQFLGPDGAPQAVSTLANAVAGEALLQGAGPNLPPGVYIRADSGSRNPGESESVVVNLMTESSELAAMPDLPSGVTSETLGGTAPERYGAWFIAAAIVLLLADVLGTLVVSGRLSSRAKQVALSLALVVFAAPMAEAQDVGLDAIPATAETTLGFVRTGDSQIDRISERAMIGLGNALARRTAVEPGPPRGVTPGSDELSFYPVLYWPLRESTLPERPALDALAGYLKGGGLLIIDTQNGASGFGGASATQLREIARALNLPPLAPVNEDHVLTRTFYLLNAFPGRWRGARIWTEAAPPREEGVPEASDIPQFDRIDDNVSPVIVGSADWAAAWAVDERGFPMFPIGRPGDRQREMAIRFGVNAVMYALTGNYKSDQVHAPAVLQRLGQ